MPKANEFEDQIESFNTQEIEELRKTIQLIIQKRASISKISNEKPSHNLAKHSLLAGQADADQNPCKRQQKAKELLAHVNNANYHAIEKAWNKNPQLMLTPVIDKDGTTTTPLRRALYNLDTYTWKPFLEHILINNPELKQQFINQHDEQKTHIDLTPLFNAYKMYAANANRLLSQLDTDPNIKDINEKIDSEWLLLGKQQKILPKHMLREFCREGDSWNSITLFDTDKQPSPQSNKIYYCSTFNYINLNDSDFDVKLGSSFALLRGEGIASCTDKIMRIKVSTLKRTPRDAEVFKRLYDTRSDDLKKIEELVNSHDMHASNSAINFN